MRRLSDGQYVGLDCHWYHPCPICLRCEDAFPEGYVRCSRCPATGCNHSTEDKNLIYGREHNQTKSDIDPKKM